MEAVTIKRSVGRPPEDAAPNQQPRKVGGSVGDAPCYVRLELEVLQDILTWPFFEASHATACLEAVAQGELGACRASLLAPDATVLLVKESPRGA